jgi:pyruvate dehydrogenase E1 component alpha subunit
MPLKEIEKFSISHLQILDEKGDVDKELEPELGDEQLLSLYRSMYMAREVDERMLKLQRQGRIGTFAPCTGHEATNCGSAFALTEEDWFVGAYRELGGRLMRGESLVNYLLYYNGYEEGFDLPAEKHTTPIAVVVGSQCLHAVGIGYALKYRGEKDRAVLTFLGDGGTSQGDFYEALNFAGVWQAPVVFFCQNNQWAISVPREKQTFAKTIAQKAIAGGIPGIQVDGNDVLAVYKATKDALDRARSGGGPTFIEAINYRVLMHTTADDPKKYRSEEEEKEWWKYDPLPRFRTYLENKKIWNADLQAGLEEEIKAEVDQAVKDFEALTDFKPDAPFDHVFGTSHPEIERQRTEFLDELGKEEGDA